MRDPTTTAGVQVHLKLYLKLFVPSCNAETVHTTEEPAPWKSQGTTASSSPQNQQTQLTSYFGHQSLFGGISTQSSYQCYLQQAIRTLSLKQTSVTGRTHPARQLSVTINLVCDVAAFHVRHSQKANIFLCSGFQLPFSIPEPTSVSESLTMADRRNYPYRPWPSEISPEEDPLDYILGGMSESQPRDRRGLTPHQAPPVSPGPDAPASGSAVTALERQVPREETSPPMPPSGMVARKVPRTSRARGFGSWRPEFEWANEDDEVDLPTIVTPASSKAAEELSSIAPRRLSRLNPTIDIEVKHFNYPGVVVLLRWEPAYLMWSTAIGMKYDVPQAPGFGMMQLDFQPNKFRPEIYSFRHEGPPDTWESRNPNMMLLKDPKDRLTLVGILERIRRDVATCVMDWCACGV